MSDLEPMTAEEARAYGPQWGSYMNAGDPGYIMYTAIPPERAEHRDTMVAWLRDNCLPLAREGSDEEGDEFEYSDVEMLHRMIAYLEGLSYPAELAVAVKPSNFGGGWVWGITPRGKQVLEEYYGTRPVPIKPLGGWPAYIIEPNEADDLGVYLLEEGIAWHTVP